MLLSEECWYTIIVSLIYDGIKDTNSLRKKPNIFGYKVQDRVTTRDNRATWKGGYFYFIYLFI